MINPILKREIKSLMRTPKFLIGISVYLFFLVLGVNMILSNMNYMGFIEPESILGLYYAILGVQLFVLVLVVPAVSGGAISNEREKQTLDLLLVTKMTPSKIIKGKIYSSLFTVVCLLIVTLPIYALLFYYGGVPFWYILVNAFYCMLVAVVIAYIAVFASAKFKKTTTAMVFTYLSVFVYTCVVFFLIMLLSIWLGEDTGKCLMFFDCFFNPVFNFVSLIDSQLGMGMTWGVLESFGVDLCNKYIYVWHINILTSAVLVWLLHKLSVKAVDPLK